MSLIAEHRRWARTYRPRVRVWYALHYFQEVERKGRRRCGAHWCVFGSFLTLKEMRKKLRLWWENDFARDGGYAVFVFRPGQPRRLWRRLS